MNHEYHKGDPCVYKPILCQEGYCSGCAIHLEKSAGWEFPDGDDRVDHPAEARSHGLIVSSRELAVVK